MELYLLRHGSAEPGRAGMPDSERSLSTDGEFEIRRVIAAARLGNMCPALILSSPYRRAMQTARIAADVLDYKEPVAESAALEPGGDARALWDEVRAHKDFRSLLLCGHDPLFSTATAFLLGCPELRVDFPKAGLVRIDLETFGPAPQGVLKWMLACTLIA